MAKPRTKTNLIHHYYMMDVMRQFEWDIHQEFISRKRIPAEWFDIAGRRHPQPKVKVTMWVERDVVKFFKSLGTGYQQRMNDVMRSFMHARLSGLIEGAEAEGLSAISEAEPDGPRPEIGEVAALAKKHGLGER